MEHLGLAALAAFILSFGLISRRLESTSITGPMIFAAFGVIAGPALLGILELDVESEVVNGLAEATLVLVLFADAARIDLKILRKNFQTPGRLLGIGLPLTMLLGAGVALLLFESLSIWEAALVAVILAPTDAALGQAVVSSPKVPVRIRQALNVESGLNDGMCVPFVMILIALASGDSSQPAEYWLSYAAGQLLLGPAAGIVVGYLGGRLVSLGFRTKWMSHAFLQLSSLAVALLAFSAAEMIGGNGFIAAFVAGLTLGNTSRDVCEDMMEFAETEGQLLGLLAFLAFGAANIVPAIQGVDGPVLLYAVLSLTVIRMLPVAVSLLGTGFRLPTYAFLGWFGPRGLASILYVLMALRAEEIAGREDIFAIVVATVLLSVFAHGFSAVPGASWYAEHSERRMAVDPQCAEGRMVEEIPVRLPFRGSRSTVDT